MPVAVRLLEALREARAEVALVLTEGAERVLAEETGGSAESLTPLAQALYRDSDLGAPIASGSHPTRGMAIVPCSSNTVARLALGLSDSLLTRAAHVHLKEHRRLVLVPRESPLSPILLGHLTRLSELGVIILPLAPAYYLHPRTVAEVTDFMAGRVLDHLGVAHSLYRGWQGTEPP